MKLVVDIKEDYYEIVKHLVNVEHSDFKPYKIIANGTPLPEGYGRLIDADEAIQILKSLGNRDYRREKGTIQDAIKMLSYDEYTPTIIEADKTESEE